MFDDETVLRACHAYEQATEWHKRARSPSDCIAITAITAIWTTWRSITIRNLDERTKQRLRLMAAQHGRSMEDQARRIIKDALDTSQGKIGRKETLSEAFRRLFETLGGVELELPPRDYGRDPPTFD